MHPKKVVPLGGTTRRIFKGGTTYFKIYDPLIISMGTTFLRHIYASKKSGPLSFKGGPHILKYMIPLIISRGTTFLTHIYASKKSGPPKFQGGTTYFKIYGPPYNI